MIVLIQIIIIIIIIIINIIINIINIIYNDTLHMRKFVLLDAICWK